jgi:hypothetical protein
MEIAMGVSDSKSASAESDAGAIAKAARKQ